MTIGMHRARPVARQMRPMPQAQNHRRPILAQKGIFFFKY